MQKIKIEVELSDEEIRNINAVLHGSEDEEYCQGSAGVLDMNKLVKMLLHDVHLTIKRPGSWEGSKMLDLLESHGYDNTVFRNG